MNGMHAAVIVAAGVAIVGALVALVFLPSREAAAPELALAAAAAAARAAGGGGMSEAAETAHGGGGPAAPAPPRPTRRSCEPLSSCCSRVAIAVSRWSRSAPARESGRRRSTGATAPRRSSSPRRSATSISRFRSLTPARYGRTSSPIAQSAIEGVARVGAATFIPRMLADAAGDPEMHAIFYANLVAPRRAIMTGVLRAAIDRGELRADLDVEQAIDVLTGPWVYRILISGGDTERGRRGQPVGRARSRPARDAGESFRRGLEKTINGEWSVDSPTA